MICEKICDQSKRLLKKAIVLKSRLLSQQTSHIADPESSKAIASVQHAL